MNQSTNRSATDRLLCLGMGYSASALGRIVWGEGWRVGGACRDEASRDSLLAQGYEAAVFDGEAPGAEFDELLSGATHLLASAPPGDDGDPFLSNGADQIAHLKTLQWVGYLSTTGVYGDRNGGWVDETSPLQPTGDRGRRRVAAEAAWLDLWRDHGVPVHVFRLAGIYGPGRNQIAAVRAGTAKRIDKPGQVFSRIHVDDIAGVLHASIQRLNPGAIYNVCDDEAAPPSDVTAYIAAQTGVAPPPLTAFEDAELSAMGRSFYRDNKRVSNQRIKEELGVELKWPNYRVGLKALMSCA
jgi:nucleoside-diphosphate-sugar epimerase